MVLLMVSGCGSEAAMPTNAAVTPTTEVYFQTEQYTIVACDDIFSYRHGTLINHKLCRQYDTGETAPLVEHVFSEVVLSPDQQWFAFAVQDQTTVHLDLYRMRVDGTGLQRLTKPDGQRFVGMRRLVWSQDGKWITMSTWTGSGPSDQESSWKDYRIQTDGSATLEPVS